MKTNYHTHLKLCGHALGMTEDYVKKAIELGFDEIGMSDHGPIPREWMTPEEYQYNWLERQMTLSDFHQIYLPDIDQAISKYKDKIKILKAIEIEYVEGHDDFYEQLRSHLDYMNLGVHYVFHQKTVYNLYEPINHEEIAYYADNIEKALATGYFKILVHPDLFLFNYTSSAGMHREFDSYARKVALRIIEAAVKNDVALEINAGGIAKQPFWIHGKMERPYPRTEFWKLVKPFAKSGEIKVIIGADAHIPDALGDLNYQKTIEFAKELGIPITDQLRFDK